ncbi:MAG: ParB/RepB/Spo0J family partition protein [Clostridia bacterium]|nr:ParB/RepB/Spo0J family partition protein [Clostridia bacterium]
MALKKGVLGRGLDAILLDNNSENQGGTTVLRVSDIEPSADQPRKNFNVEELSSLADSIKEYGLIQPITVRRVGERYQIIAGERRWRAARMAGLSEVPVSIISADDKKAAEMALVENIQRSDLDPIEEAEAFSSLIEEYGLTQEEVGRRTGRSRTSVTNTLRLLELPKEVRKMLSDGTLSEGHAKVLMGLKDDVKIENAAQSVVARGLSVRETEKLVRELMAPARPTQSKTRTAEANEYSRQLEGKLTTKLARPVKIVQNGEKSSLNIGFTDNNDLEKILVLLCGEDFVNSL